MPPRTLQKYVDVASHAAREAGALLARHIGEPTKVETKLSIVDLVTEIDRASELLIQRILKRHFPDFGFIGEEHGSHKERARFRWIVDPLDGTMNFVHGVPFFGISIGLEKEGELIAGVIYDPIRKEMFHGLRGYGAFVQKKRLKVSRTRLLSTSLLSTGFASTFRAHPQKHLKWFKAFESNSHAVRRMGSTALSLAYVAAGRLEGFYEQNLKSWDIAGGILLVQEAGGQVSNFKGKQPELARGELVASNGRIHNEMLRLLRGRTPSSRRR